MASWHFSCRWEIYFTLRSLHRYIFQLTNAVAASLAQHTGNILLFNIHKCVLVLNKNLADGVARHISVAGDSDDDITGAHAVIFAGAQ